MSYIAASPTTRKLAAEKGIDIDALGRALGTDMVTKADIIRKASGGSVPAAPLGRSYWDVDHSDHGSVTAQKRTHREKIAAANLTAAQQLIPMVTHHDWADVSAMQAARKRLHPEADTQGAKLTALAFHVKALAKTLAVFPTFNASLSADGATLWLKQFFHIGIAVDTPHGLMVPVIRDVDRKGLLAIAGEIRDLALRARARKVRPDEMGGASISISNLGGIGGTGFTPIVNPPEVAILGITKTEIRPVWNGEVFEPRQMVPLDLSYDHRVVNGADAAAFLVHYAGLVAEPDRLVL